MANSMRNVDDDEAAQARSHSFGARSHGPESTGPNISSPRMSGAIFEEDIVVE